MSVCKTINLAFSAEAEGQAGGTNETGGAAPQQDTISASHLLQDLPSLCSPSPFCACPFSRIPLKICMWRYELTAAAGLFKAPIVTLVLLSLLLNPANVQNFKDIQIGSWSCVGTLIETPVLMPSLRPTVFAA